MNLIKPKFLNTLVSKLKAVKVFNIRYKYKIRKILMVSFLSKYLKWSYLKKKYKYVTHISTILTRETAGPIIIDIGKNVNKIKMILSCIILIT